MAKTRPATVVGSRANKASAANAVRPELMVSSTKTMRRPSIRGSRCGSRKTRFPGSGDVIELTDCDSPSQYQNLRE